MAVSGATWSLHDAPAKVGSPPPNRAVQQSTILHRRSAAPVKAFGCRPERERSTRYKAGIRKPPMKDPARSSERLAVYGDLTWQRLWRAMIFPKSLRAGNC